jgi:LysM repeat protein
LILALAGVTVGGCSAGSGRMYGTGQITTSSIQAPRPVEDMVQEPAPPYSDGYGLGRSNDEAHSATPPRLGQYQWNGSPTRIQEGAAPTQAPAKVSPAADGRRLVVVRPGDTLYSISRQQGVSVQDLMTANRLAGPALYVGQTLSVPPPTIR